jgi:hypothetical protein
VRLTRIEKWLNDQTIWRDGSASGIKQMVVRHFQSTELLDPTPARHAEQGQSSTAWKPFSQGVTCVQDREIVT